MLCTVCCGVFGGNQPKQDIWLTHQPTLQQLQDSSLQGCWLCTRIILRAVSPTEFLPGTEYKLTSYTLYIRATLPDGAGTKPESGQPQLTFRLYESPEGATPNRPEVGDRTDSEASFYFAQCALRDCLDNHPTCTPDIRWFPTRLIEIDGSLAVTTLRLVNTAEGIPDASYMTLSHCWGKKQLIRLTTDNQMALMAGFSLDLLPKTFKDAIGVAQRLGIRYVWIDSMCIVQDSLDDWEKEASLMHKVYSHSYCNITASAASDSSQGLFFARDPNYIQHCFVSLAWEGPQVYLLFDRTDFEIYHDLEGEPLQRRAWVLQERLLSPRAIFFARNQLYFECQRSLCCEANPNHLTPIKGLPYTRSWRSIPTGDLFSFATLRKQDAGLTWRRIVEGYSRCNLTFQSDKMAAMAGLAQKLAKLSGNQFFLGLWLQTIAFDLAWRVKGAAKKQEIFIAPSWSWVSRIGEVEFPFKDVDVEADPLICTVAEKVQNSDPTRTFGSLTSAILVVEANLITAVFVSEGQFCTERSRSQKAADGGPGLTTIFVSLDDGMPSNGRYCSAIPLFKDPYRMVLLLLEPQEGESECHRRIGLAAVWLDPFRAELEQSPTRKIALAEYGPNPGAEQRKLDRDWLERMIS